MAVQVNPIVARKGNFMESFKMDEKNQMFGFIAAAEAFLENTKVTGQRIVYTKIPQWAGSRRFDMLQVFIIPEGLVSSEDEKIDPHYKVKEDG